jgi:GNAT superfamily N-acetyltransferase
MCARSGRHRDGHAATNVTPPQNQSECKIRDARTKDYAQMAELAQQLGYASTTDDIAARIAPIQGSPEYGAFVAESVDGKIAGWIAMFVYRCVEADARVEVSGLVVDSRARSQGVGKRLLDRAEQWARDKGYHVIGLRTNVVRERAHVFYERQGYKHTKTQRTYRKEL